MLDYSVKIGLLPMRRDVAPRDGIFNHEKAERRAVQITEHLRSTYSSGKIGFASTEDISKGGLVFADADADAVIEHFTRQRIEALFIINCNFGNELLAAQIAHTLGKPVLIWAPLDDEFAPDGMRFTDSQCGLFGLSRQLQRMNVPFSFIESCRVTDSRFDRGFDRFCRVACMVKNFRSMRVAQVGTRPRAFGSVMYNESELLQRFDIQIVPVNMALILNKFNHILKTRHDELRHGAAELLQRFDADEGTTALLEKLYAFVLLYQDIAAENRVCAIASECWSSMLPAMGLVPCAAYSLLADMGYILSCEADVHGAITMALLSCAAMGESVPFFGEFTVRHPENPEAELLWHCGPFAQSLKKSDSRAKLVDMRVWLEVRDGEYTVARFDQEDGAYRLLNGKCRSTEGPYTFGTYLWAEFDDLDSLERKLIDGPYIHHVAEIEGDYTAELREFCRFIKSLQPDNM